MEKKLLLGDEAIAVAAIEAGISGVYAYPGTPSTEITEYIQKTCKNEDVHNVWCCNEKTAMETALGASYVGKRALVCMKHVGMNVAADGFINSALTGANGGLVVVVADDPSMHSSQNEQDSRFYGKFAFTPMFEPHSQQEAYQITKYGYDFSEKYKIPVLLRITTRLAHSRAVVECGQIQTQNQLKMPSNPKQWVLMPAMARQRYNELLEDYEKFKDEAERSPFNKYIDADDKSIGVIACGIAYNYLMENWGGIAKHPTVKISQYPLPEKMIQKLAMQCDKILVMEEGQPFVEQQLRSMVCDKVKIKGRLDGSLPRVGELTSDNVKMALGLPQIKSETKNELVLSRPPALCKGCGHRDLYDALNSVLKENYTQYKVFSDIGCYTLGALPPYRAIDTCVDMGASITMAKGAADMGLHPSVAVIGDSTFTHSGMTGLLDAVNANANIVVIISDNLTTAMTGGQNSAGTNKIEQICLGLGVDPKHVKTFVPLPKNIEAAKQMIKEEIDYNGVSVIIPRRECIQTLKRHLKDVKNKL